jgi:hypothetical protein
MKNSTKKISTLFKTLLAGIFLTSTIVACSDKDDNIIIIPKSTVSVTQASYDVEALDLFVNKEKTKANFEFTHTLNYVDLLAGKNSITIKEAGKADTLLTSEIDFKEGKTYSIFIANTIEDIEYVLIEDNLTAPKEGEAKVRFVNMSPESTNLDILVKDEDTNLFENAEFKAASSFKELTPGTYTFEIKQADSEDVLFSLEDVKIEKGKIYTIWTKGIVDGTDAAEFGAKVIVNK